MSTIDILPTLTSVLGFRRVNELAGQDLTPVIKGKTGAAEKRFLYSHLHLKAGTPQASLQKASLNRSFKYIFEAPDDHFFFDLKRDPGEDRNLYSQERKAAKTLASRLFSFEKACPRYNAAYVDIPLDQKSIEQLRSLGYIR